MTQLIALVDMDGPLAGFDERFWERCVTRGFTFDIDGPPFQTERYLTQHLPVRRERRLAEKMIDEPGWFRDLPVVDGAQDGIAALEAAGLDVWVCTKPKESNPTCRDDKAAWLAGPFGRRDLVDKLIVTPHKGMVVGDVLLDDAPKPGWFTGASWAPVIFDSPFNRHGSDWGHLPHWDWSKPVPDLLAMIEQHRLGRVP